MVNHCNLLKCPSHRLKSAWFILLMLLTFATPTASFAAASSKVSSTSITHQDLLSLQVSLDGDFSGNLDTSILENDFDIDSQSVSKSRSTINGRVRQLTQWTLSLLPKRTGLLTIPEFKLGTEKTQQIAIQVSSGEKPTPDSPIQLSADIETTSPYVQQPVIIKLTLLYRGQIGNAKFQYPDTNGAILDNLSDPTTTKVRIGKYNYTQWEQMLVLIPQTPGSLELDPISFRADTITSAFRRRPMIRRTAPLKFEVKGIPTSYPKNEPWLPAKEIIVSDTLVKDSALMAQEPFTRTITVKAIGNIADAIPTLVNAPHPQFKQYPEPPTEETVFENNTLVGSKSLVVALIPLSGTKASLPETTVHWWNTANDTLEQSTISQKTVVIDGAEITSSPDTTPTAVPSTKQIKAQPLDETHEKPLNNVLTDWWKQPSTLIATIAITLWLLTISMWLIYRKVKPPVRLPSTSATDAKSKRTKAKTLDPKSSIEEAKRAVKEGCKKEEPKLTADSLIKWFNLAFPHSTVHSISALIQCASHPQLQKALKDLETHLYRDPSVLWNAKIIAQQFTDLEAEEPSESVFAKLEPLYLDDQN